MYNRELITFIAVANQSSFLKAARELYITPASETVRRFIDII